MTGSQCLTCAHKKTGLKCEFFPKGIPAEIASGVEPHAEYRHYKLGTTWENTPEELKL